MSSLPSADPSGVDSNCASNAWSRMFFEWPYRCISQDPLEKYFGMQRQKGKTNDNPTIMEVIKMVKP